MTSGFRGLRRLGRRNYRREHARGQLEQRQREVARVMDAVLGG